jgi:hypothetical protein
MSILQQIPDPFALNPFNGVIPVPAPYGGVLGVQPFTHAGSLSVDVPALNTDPNSPAVFANNIQIAHSMSLRIQQLALNLISNMLVKPVRAYVQ